MRTTFTLDDDVAAAVEQVRRQEGIGPSEAVNRLIRQGLVAPVEPYTYLQRSYPLGLKIDVTNIGEVLAMLDGGDVEREQGAG